MSDRYVGEKELREVLTGATVLGECEGCRESKWTGWRAFRAVDGRVFAVVTGPDGDLEWCGHETTIAGLDQYGVELSEGGAS